MKPEYLFQPRVFFRRCLQKFTKSSPKGIKQLKTSFKVLLEVDTKDIVGKAIWTFKVYDLAVSEVIYRLLDTDSLAIDGGANIGYMSSIMALKSPKGQIWAFEPNPNTAKRLKLNSHMLNDFKNIHIIESALSNDTIELNFYVNPRNAGESRVVSDDEQFHLKVSGERLDKILEPLAYKLFKLDIEGYEYEALLGSENLLKEGLIENVLFEDIADPLSPSKSLLQSFKYKIFKIEKTLFGPVLLDITVAKSGYRYEALNFIATRNELDLRERLKSKGWFVLNA